MPDTQIISKAKLPGSDSIYEFGVRWGNVREKPDLTQIIDVLELPSENINIQAFYRVPTATVYYNKFIQNQSTCEVVAELPSIGVPAADLEAGLIYIYYVPSEEEFYGYIDEALSQAMGVPVGWYLVSTLMQGAGYTWYGASNSFDDLAEEPGFQVLLSSVLYHHDTAWKKIDLDKIGWHGTGVGAEIFNDPFNVASDEFSHAEGSNTTASGQCSHAEGYHTVASDGSSHAEGNDTVASGYTSHAEGNITAATGDYSHAEGEDTTASGDASHAEGLYTTASGTNSHAEGGHTEASGEGSHAEGGNTVASSDYSHAEGGHTTASGLRSHAEGGYTTASGGDSHAEGYYTTASGAQSHAEGLRTKATGRSQHVFGEYNIPSEDDTAAGYNPNNRGTYVEIVGNGITINARSNARTLDWSGNEVLAGKLTVGAAPTANMDVTTKGYVDGLIAANDAMRFKGTIGDSESSADINELPASHRVGDTWKAVTVGYWAGQVCDAGDLIICVETGTVASNDDWTVAQGNLDGAVTGPASSTTEHIATFNGTTGKVIKDSGYTIGKSVPVDAVFTDTNTTYTFAEGTTDGAFSVTPSGGSAQSVPVHNVLRTGDIASWAKATTKPSYTKSEVGLGSVDNTSDANKPISTATQTALDAKAPLASPALTGTPTAPTPTSASGDTQIATKKYVDDSAISITYNGTTSTLEIL